MRISMKILIYQAKSAFGNVNSNLEAIEQTLNAAAKMNVDVAVFPELFLSRYNLGQRLRDVALIIDGPQIARICQLAENVDVAVVVKFPEKDGQNLFNTAIAIMADSAVVTKHRKFFCLGIARRKSFSPATGLRLLRSRTILPALARNQSHPMSTQIADLQSAKTRF